MPREKEDRIIHIRNPENKQLMTWIEYKRKLKEIYPDKYESKVTRSLKALKSGDYVFMRELISESKT